MSDTARSSDDGERPNIVVIMSDQHRADSFDIDGSGEFATPHLRHLMERGTHFATAWTQSPVCQPARAALITGRYPTDLGVVRNYDCDFDSSWPTFMGSLQALGYRTANIGKTHYLGSKEVESLGTPLNARDWEDDIRAFGFDDVIEEFDAHIHTSPGFRSAYLEHLDNAGLLPTYLEMIRSVMPFTDAHWRGIESALPQGADHADFMTESAVVWIDAAPTDQPLFLQLSYVQPHSPLIANSRWRGHYRGRVPARRRGELAAGRTTSWEDHLADLRVRSQTERLTEPDYISAEESYRGMISMIDEGIGRVIGALESRGLAGSTWILYTSDHGEMMGEHGLMGKACFYRGAVEVPLIVCPPPSAPSAAHRVDSIVQAVDVPATVLDIAGAPPLSGCRGSSLLGQLDGSSGPSQDALAVSEIGGYASPASVFRAMSDGQSRLTLDLSTGEICEIFNLSDDPFEDHNLLGTREGGRIAADLNARAEKLQLASGQGSS